MGMYDYVKTEIPLPRPAPTGVEWFQTKDTPSQFLERYVIKADGRLVRLEYEEEEVPLEDRPRPGLPWIGMFKRVGEPREVEVEDFHADVFFYHYESLEGGHEWWEYRARFTEGTCTSIKLHEHKIVKRDPDPSSEGSSEAT